MYTSTSKCVLTSKPCRLHKFVVGEAVLSSLLKAFLGPFSDLAEAMNYIEASDSKREYSIFFLFLFFLLFFLTCHTDVGGYYIFTQISRIKLYIIV